MFKLSRGSSLKPFRCSHVVSSLVAAVLNPLVPPYSKLFMALSCDSSRGSHVVNSYPLKLCYGSGGITRPVSRDGQVEELYSMLWWLLSMQFNKKIVICLTSFCLAVQIFEVKSALYYCKFFTILHLLIAQTAAAIYAP